ncbi:MAG: TetR/AcrR family transcriptional regulator [Microbacterium sp.]
MEDRRVTRSKALILDAARACFAEHGLDDTSVEDVAERAGIAKRTIYNIYGDKETLFRAAVAVSIDIAERFNADLLEQVKALRNPATDLPALAARLARDALLGPVVPMRLLVARESHRFPDLAAEYRDRAPEAVIRTISAGLAHLAEVGALEIPDAGIAAEQFAFLVLGAELDRRMFGDARTSAADVESRAIAGAETFLRAYASASQR